MGWYCGLATRFTNHYYTVIKKDDLKSRCGTINMEMLRGKTVSSLKLIKFKSKNICASCKNLLEQDEGHTKKVEPFRY